MNHLIVYISAQQRMQDALQDASAKETRSPASSRRLVHQNLGAVRHTMSTALYRLADTVRPYDEPVDVPLTVAQ